MNYLLVLMILTFIFGEDAKKQNFTADVELLKSCNDTDFIYPKFNDCYDVAPKFSKEYKLQLREAFTEKCRFRNKTKMDIALKCANHYDWYKNGPCKRYTTTPGNCIRVAIVVGAMPYKLNFDREYSLFYKKCYYKHDKECRCYSKQISNVFRKKLIEELEKDCGAKDKTLLDKLVKCGQRNWDMCKLYKKKINDSSICVGKAIVAKGL